MTETTPTVHQAWSAVMADVREVRKDQKNEQQKYLFRGIDAVMNAVGPVLREHRVHVSPIKVDLTSRRDFTAKSGAIQHETIVTVDYLVTGPAGDSFVMQSIGESADTSDKATAQAMSVAYRTLLLQALCLPTDDPDPDSRTPEAPATVEEPKPEYGDEERREVYAKLDGILRTKADNGAVIEWLQTENITAENLTRDQARLWWNRMESMTDAPKATEAKALPKAQREKEWAALMDGHSKLDETTRDFVKKALDHEFPGVTIGKDTLTREQAVHWHALITEALEAPM